MPPYYFFLYSTGVHLESPKYKMIFLKSPKSSEYVFLTNRGQKSLSMFISLCLTIQIFFENSEIKNKS